jgi:hypothetical protein
MSDPSGLRVADADRERVIEELHEHTVAGRLTPAELEERLGLAYSAKTRAELDVVKADLPVSTVAARRALTARKAHLRRRLLQEAGVACTASAVCIAVWFASGAGESFWPIWVIIFTVLPLVRDGWLLLGPGSDLDVVEARLQARHERHLSKAQRRSTRRRSLR